MHVKLLFTKNQLLKYSCNLSSNKRILNRNNSFYLLGLYKNISIINTNIQLMKIKRNVYIILNFCYKTNYSNPFLINTISNIFVQKMIAKLYKRFKVSYLVGRWWTGLLKNFKRGIKFNIKKKETVFVFNNKYPNYCLYFGYQSTEGKSDVSGSFYLESSRLSLLNICFINTSNNIMENLTSVFYNTQSVLSSIMTSHYFLSIVRKSKIVLKKKFVFFIVNNWNAFKLSKNNRILFYEFYNKKNKISKKNIWQNI